MNTNIKQFHVNDEVRTPNGVGVMQGVMIENGWQYVLVRHNIKDMKQMPAERCLTKKVLEVDNHLPTGLWYYDPREVTHA